MAQQTVNFEIAAHTKGMESIAKLINEVGTLQKEMKSLQQATANTTSGFSKASQAIRGHTNVLDAQSKALRNARQGSQMAMMQVNDFVTSVSTGASPVQAFNQQIGQLGYSMTLMSGKAGAVGRFLAGPWGLAIIGVSTLLGFAAKSANDASDSMVSFGDYALATAQSIGQKISEQLTPAIEAIQPAVEFTGKIFSGVFSGIIEIINAVALAANIMVRMLIESVRQAFKVAVELVKATAGLIARTLNWVLGKAETFANSIIPTINRALEFMGFSARIPEAAFGRINVVGSELLDTIKGVGGAIQSAGKAAEGFQLIDLADISRRAIENGLNRAKEAGGKAGKAASEAAKKASEYVFRTGVPIKALREGDKPLDLKFPDLTKEMIKVPPAMQEILDKNEELENSFESIGNAVAQGFKGMITGAQSFGDAMKGIIQAVIDELFRLYVVQQIVGFVKTTLSNAFGVPDAKALGGSVSANTPYIVGERGPELFMPSKSGTIIPNQNLPGGGTGGSIFNISVDARGSADPEAVRQQVQQGILEAAPSIVAAAQNRTIEAIRRPRLAGTL